MTLIVAELRTALAKANVPDDLAEAAAKAVAPADKLDLLVTKADLAAAISDAKYDLLKWFAAILVAQGLGIVTATVALVKLL